MRLTILGGYLGAGKTTWLRHQRHAGLFTHAHVLVNEAAGTPVDHALLPGAQVLAGGCACCDGREALLTALRAQADLASRRQGRDVILETSGLADPGAILTLVQTDPVLRHHVRLQPTLVLVDALHALQQIAGDALLRRQIAAADQLVVTKVDGAETAQLGRLVGVLQGFAPAARITGSSMGEDRPLPPPVPMDLPPVGTDAMPRPHLLHLPLDTDWTALSVWLSALLHARGHDIVRIKGVVRAPAGRLLVQTVRRAVQRPEVLPEEAGADDNRLVFIGRGFDPLRLDRSFRRNVLGKGDQPRSAGLPGIRS
ncbi:CobW family GTP-binding protein [Falsirhodobacter sp. 1013]|uniref:CobW family GTP-binding protein n=1 Tax=Falsirhodobacter sp. 1013 TaxID=3417566 RepID=UPI003EB80EE4